MTNKITRRTWTLGGASVLIGGAIAAARHVATGTSAEATPGKPEDSTPAHWQYEPSEPAVHDEIDLSPFDEIELRLANSARICLPIEESSPRVVGKATNSRSTCGELTLKPLLVVDEISVVGNKVHAKVCLYGAGDLERKAAKTFLRDQGQAEFNIIAPDLKALRLSFLDCGLEVLSTELAPQFGTIELTRRIDDAQAQQLKRAIAAGDLELKLVYTGAGRTRLTATADTRLVVALKQRLESDIKARADASGSLPYRQAADIIEGLSISQKNWAEGDRQLLNSLKQIPFTVDEVMRRLPAPVSWSSLSAQERLQVEDDLAHSRATRVVEKEVLNRVLKQEANSQQVTKAVGGGFLVFALSDTATKATF